MLYRITCRLLRADSILLGAYEHDLTTVVERMLGLAKGCNGPCGRSLSMLRLYTTTSCAFILTRGIDSEAHGEDGAMEPAVDSLLD